ncbi:hypothetical protein GCM10023063_47590 [Arthrobacter methylotrophus]|uniref:NAD-binding protein n=1 Tax=Arthrobacter methylotrophus TaxID=121291 RepID=A0ABV5UW95_9MICC
MKGPDHEQPGNGQAAKLVNNLILGVNMNALAEGLKFGAQYNLPESGGEQRTP